MPKFTAKSAQAVLMALPLISGAGFAVADEASAKPGVSIELSAADTKDQHCLLSFLVENSHDADISGAVFETVLFDTNGQVALLTLLDFEDLPAGRPRVRQFQFENMVCNQISRILINGVEKCEAAGSQSDACRSGLKLKSRLETELIG